MKYLKHLGLLLILFISNFTIAQGVICDDFTNLDLYPELIFDADELLGYSQGGTQTITSGIGTFGHTNGTEPGIFAVGSVDFNFDGTYQNARFLVYGFDYQFEDMGFSVNGSETIFLDDVFPMTVLGVEVDIDLSPENIDDWEYFYLTFTGDIDVIQHELFESAVVELCVEPLFEDGECDDFTDIETYPLEGFSPEEIFAYSQSGTHPITSGVGAAGEFGGDDATFPGMYIVFGPVEFDFDGSAQEVRFKMYGWFADGEESFSVNGSSFHALNESYPMVVDGITIDRDDSPEDFDSWDYVYLTLSGEIDDVTLDGVEFGVTELCVGPIEAIDIDYPCDDFRDIFAYPEATYLGEDVVGDTIGYTQGGTQTIILGEHSEAGIYCTISSSGIYTGGSTIDFAFDGTSQSARFHLGESSMGPGAGRSFSVNGSTYTPLHGDYPMIIDGVIIDMDTTTVPDLIVSYVDVYLTFSGNLDLVSIRAEDFHESNIIALCVEPLFEEEDCDDFSNLELYPEMSWTGGEIVEGDIIGTTQGGLYDITFGVDGVGECHLNNFEEYEGIWGLSRVNFAFSGETQTARFKIYYWDGSEDVVGFSVNGSVDFFLDDSYPMTIDGVEVNLDTSLDDIYGDMNCAYLTYTGTLTEVAHIIMETGILELCVEPIFEEGDCNDFTNLEYYPEIPITTVTGDMVGDIIGTTQGGTQPITIEAVADGWLMRNVDPGQGFYGGVELGFGFDGTDQSAQFHVYGWVGDGTTIGFSVNGSTFITFDETFPMVVDGISVDIDLSAPDVGSFEGFYLTLSGELDNVNLLLFESGILELCVGPPADEDVPCDDFTSEPWPMDEIFEPGEVIGYTYNGEFPVTVGATGSVHVNTDPVYFPGLFINNAPLIFEFDGSDQMVQFEIYEWFGAGSEGFELNGEPLTLFDDTYPMTIDGVEIDLVLSGLSVGTAELAHITFSGELDEITMVGGEFGITGICYESDSTILVGAGLNDEEKNLISVYPNPADEFISISSIDLIQDIRIYTIAGGLVYSMPNVNKNQVTLDTEELEQGLYLVEMILSDGTRVIEKVILE